MARRKSEEADGDILIKVGRVGAAVKEIALNGHRTVEDALAAAGLTKKESEVIQVNGEEIDEDEMDMELEDGDRVVLVKNIEGGNE